MKNILGCILTLFFLVSFSLHNEVPKTDFKSNLIEYIDLKKYTITLKYIPIVGNFEFADTSEIHVKEPSLEEYMNFARSLPSYLVYITRKSDTLFRILMVQKNEENQSPFYYEITDIREKKTQSIKSNIWGEITEKRVDEIISNKYDPKSEKGAIAGTNPHQFMFNQIIYGYQPYERLKNEVVELTKLLVK